MSSCPSCSFFEYVHLIFYGDEQTNIHSSFMIQGWFTSDINWFQRSNLDSVYNKRCDYFSNIAADYFKIGLWEMLLHRQRSGRRHGHCVGVFNGQGGKDDKGI